MSSRTLPVSLLVATLLAASAPAQDSVAKSACLPGDGTSPYADSSALLGSEQVNSYVVDMTPISTSWGGTFGFAPIIKSSKVSSNFTGSLISAQAMSRCMLQNAPLASNSYQVWNAAGAGINNNPAINDPGGTINTAGLFGNQFGVGFAEFSNTDLGADYNGVVGGLVSIIPDRPSRLYVTKVIAAVNGCDGQDNVSQFGVGSIDEAGRFFFRADGFNITGAFSSCSPLAGLSGDNIFKVDLGARSAAARNVVSNDYPGGAFDAGATEWLIRNAPLTHTTPGVQCNPGGTPNLIDFTETAAPASLFARGPAFGSITTDGTHVAPGVGLIRGTISWTEDNIAFLSSSGGIAAGIGLDNVNNEAIFINLFGLDASANVTGKTTLTLPSVVTDNDDGYTNIPGTNEFDHYKSQVAFRGGNGQVAMGLDQKGRLLVAAEVVHPDDSNGPGWGWNYIAVARVSADGSMTEWTMAAHCDGTIQPGGTGKSIKNGPGGAEIAKLVEFGNITGGGGPSVSAPMIDEAGNVWFIGAIQYPNFDTRSALIRAVYDPVKFAYELELVLQTGTVLRGQNSSRDYLITFLAVPDSNSVSSSTAWSQNISGEGHLGRSIANLKPRDERTLGGLVINTAILYDQDQDGTFSDCAQDPFSDDIDYNVLAYIGYPGIELRRVQNRPASGHQ